MSNQSNQDCIAPAYLRNGGAISAKSAPRHFVETPPGAGNRDVPSSLFEVLFILNYLHNCE